jgi:uncharacterized protein YdhG (YjbR/CyaY superfamily)
MVQSAAVSVDSWMLERDPERRAIFDQLREACKAELSGWEERMEWGMPGYGPSGERNVVSFNDQKRHIAFYAGQTAVERFGDALVGVDCGKGCVRYRRPDQVDLDTVRAMLRDIRSRSGPMC